MKVGTEVIAPPGAQMCTPIPPSIVGPLEDQVYGAPKINFSLHSGESGSEDTGF